MKRCCKDEDGTPYGWGRILDYIGVEWENEPEIYDQLSLDLDNHINPAL